MHMDVFSKKQVVNHRMHQFIFYWNILTLGLKMSIEAFFIFRLVLLVFCIYSYHAYAV